MRPPLMSNYAGKVVRRLTETEGKIVGACRRRTLPVQKNNANLKRIA
jgi:hypothetical protein